MRVFASARSAGKELGGLTVEEATPEALSAGDLDLCLFSVGTSASRELVPHAVRGGAMCVDKSAAFRLEPGIPLVVPEVNGARAAEHDGIVANPNCCAIPLTIALKPLHDAAGPAPRARRDLPVGVGRGRAGDGASARPSRRTSTTCAWTGASTASSSTRRRSCARRRARSSSCRTCRSARRCVRVPVMVGHAEAVWIETEEPLSAEQATELLRAAPGVRLEQFPTPGQAAGGDDVLVGRIRRDPTVENGLALFVVGDNLRKGAALNAIQIAELLLAEQRVAA